MKQPVWIEQPETLILHAQLLARHGGAPGLRDESLLQSALARPRQLYAYGERTELISLAAAYAAGIIRNHPFIDGNKRIGFVLCALFLEVNGCRFVASEEDATKAVLGLAAGSLEEPAFAAWLRKNVRRIRGSG